MGSYPKLCKASLSWNQQNEHFAYHSILVFTLKAIILVGVILCWAGLQQVLQAQDFDFGDAPDVYGTLFASNGPHHVITPPLALGAFFDDEPDAVPAAAFGDPATSDDTDAAPFPDDEDGILSAPAIPGDPGQPFTVSIAICNLGRDPGLSQDSHTKCWIDFNHNGTFEESESELFTVGVTGGPVFYDFSFTTPADVLTGTTYMRCRTSWEAAEVALPTGPATSGEVEDYEVNIGSLPVELSRFTAEVSQERSVELEWETLSEQNNTGFDIEVNWNGEGFRKIHFEEGAGTTLETQSYQYTVADLSPGVYQFRLRQIDQSGSSVYSTPVEVVVDMPGDYLLEPAYPNPFNPTTQVRFTSAQPEPVQLALYSIHGQWIRTLYDATPEAGITQVVPVDAEGLPSGTYIVRLNALGYTDSQKIILLK